MLIFKQLIISTHEKRILFKAEDIELEAGIVALVGRNGAGKSTLFKTIMGLHALQEGRIDIEGKDIRTHRRDELAKKVAIVFSKSTVFGNHTGRDLLYLGRLPYQNMFSKRTAVDNQIVDQIIELLDLSDFVDREFMQMSDGEKQLMMIGRAMAQDTPIILLDEPNAFLDLVNRHRVMKVLQKIGNEARKLVLFSTHEIDFLPQICQSVLLIEEGNLLQIKEKDQFISKIHTSFGLAK